MLAPERRQHIELLLHSDMEKEAANPFKLLSAAWKAGKRFFGPGKRATTAAPTATKSNIAGFINPVANIKPMGSAERKYHDKLMSILRSEGKSPTGTNFNWQSNPRTRAAWRTMAKPIPGTTAAPSSAKLKLPPVSTRATPQGLPLLEGAPPGMRHPSFHTAQASTTRGYAPGVKERMSRQFKDRVSAQQLSEWGHKMPPGRRGDIVRELVKRDKLIRKSKSSLTPPAPRMTMARIRPQSRAEQILSRIDPVTGLPKPPVTNNLINAAANPQAREAWSRMYTPK